MLRVLLVIEDYTELIYIQSLLKKTGFNVDGVQSERGFEATFLAMNPEIAVVSLKTRKLLGMELFANLKHRPKILLLANRAQIEKRASVPEFATVEGMVESPIKATDLLLALAKAGNINPEILIEKYQKIRATLGQRDGEGSKREFDTSGANGEPNRRPSRSERMNSAIAKLDVPDSQSFDKRVVQDVVKEVRQAASQNPAIQKIDEERQAFVKQLFKLGKPR